MTKWEFKKLVLDVYDACPAKIKEAAESKRVDEIEAEPELVSSAFGFVCSARVYLSAVFKTEEVHEASEFAAKTIHKLTAKRCGVKGIEEWDPQSSAGWSCYALGGCLVVSAWGGSGPASEMMVSLATAQNVQRIRGFKMTSHPGAGSSPKEKASWRRSVDEELLAFKALAPKGAISDLFVFMRDRNGKFE